MSPQVVTWVYQLICNKEKTFLCYHDANINSLYNERIFFLVNKHNFILAAKFFFEKYEMADQFKKSIANNNAGNSKQAL